MILTDKPARSAARPLRLLVLAAALGVLPLSFRALWAEPAAAATDAPADAADAEAAADVVGETDDRSIERRLDRLETMIETLADKLDGQPPAAPPDAATDAPAEAASDMPEVPAALRVSHELVNEARQATLNLELFRTNTQRWIAADRQFHAMKAAYNSQSVPLDQLLEAHRRQVEAHASYVRTNCNLCNDPARREYLFAVMSLHIADEARDEAREIWKSIMRILYEAGKPESNDAAQAREQYYQFKKQAESAVLKFQQADADFKKSQTVQPRGERAPIPAVSE